MNYIYSLIKEIYWQCQFWGLFYLFVFHIIQIKHVLSVTIRAKELSLFSEELIVYLANKANKITKFRKETLKI